MLRRLAKIDLPKDTGDFRLMDRRVVDAFNALPERNRFVRGMIAWTGFRRRACHLIWRRGLPGRPNTTTSG